MSYARWLFGVAALSNFAASAGLLFFRPQLAPIIRFDPAPGTNLFFLYFTGALIALFGFSYARVAADPVRYRVYIPFSIMGKSLAVLCACTAWIVGAVSWKIPALISMDVVFALLFLDFLRRTKT
jgi:hypothetical protein